MKKLTTFLLITIFLTLLSTSNTFAKDSPQWHLPEGAKLRLGKGSISEVKYSPDGTKLGVLSAIGIWIYDAQTGEELNLLAGHRGAVLSIAFSPDGRTLATGNDDGTVRLWDVETGKNIRTLTADRFAVNSVSFSPDGRTLAIGGFATLRLWDVERVENIRTLQESGLGYSVAFSPDGRTLAAGNMLDSVRLWDVATGENTRTVRDLGSRIFAFSPDGRTLATAGRDDIVRLWDVGPVRPWNVARRVFAMGELTGHTSKVNSVAFSPLSLDGLMLATGSSDGTVRLWNIGIRAVPGQNFAIVKSIKTLTGHTSKVVNSVAFSPDGNTLATGSSDGTVLLWGLSLSTSTLPEDVNGDGVVNILDLTLVASNFGKRGRTDADVNGDGVVNILDLTQVADTLGNTKEITNDEF